MPMSAAPLSAIRRKIDRKIFGRTKEAMEEYGVPANPVPAGLSAMIERASSIEYHDEDDETDDYDFDVEREP